MRDIQDHFIRTAAVARLEDILRAWRRPTSTLPPGLREWFAGLLSELHELVPEGGTLIGKSKDVTDVERGVVFDVLLEGNPSNEDLEEQMLKISKLHHALLENNPLPDNDFAVDLAKQFRSCFVGHRAPQ